MVGELAGEVVDEMVEGIKCATGYIKIREYEPKDCVGAKLSLLYISCYIIYFIFDIFSFVLFSVVTTTLLYSLSSF